MLDALMGFLIWFKCISKEIQIGIFRKLKKGSNPAGRTLRK